MINDWLAIVRAEWAFFVKWWWVEVLVSLVATWTALWLARPSRTFNIKRPSGVSTLRVGLILDTAGPWYVRAWRWFKSNVLRQPADIRRITHIDYENRVVTFDGPCDFAAGDSLEVKK